jgi:hypothetical protein
MEHLPWRHEWRRLSSLRFLYVFMAFRRLESLRHSFRKTLCRLKRILVFGHPPCYLIGYQQGKNKLRRQ